MAFAYYKSITLDKTQAGSGDSSNWPLTIALDGNVQAADADLKTTGSGGFVQNTNGYDIRPYSDSALTSALAYELVYYDGVNGKLEMHVKIPTLSVSSNTVIYLAFGDASLSTDGSSNTTWNSDYKLVWHLPNGSSLTASDSTSNAKNGTLQNTPTAVAGKMDGGASFVAASAQWIENTSFTALDGAAAGTLSIWFKTSTNNAGYIFSAPEDTGGSNGFDIALGNNSVDTNLVTTSGYVGSAYGVVYSDDAWHYVVATYDGTNQRIYYDGVLRDTDAHTGTIESSSTDIILARFGTYGVYYTGSLDEARVSTIARPADWVTADYNSQKNSSTFITWGSKIANGGSPAVNSNFLMFMGPQPMV